MESRILLESTPWEDAADFLKSKPAVARAVFDRMVPEIRARAFTVAGIESANVLRDIRDTIAELPRGAEWGAVKKRVLAAMGPHFIDPDASPEDRERAVGRAARHAELVMRTNGYSCTAAAQHRALQEHRDVFPAVRYNAFEDSRVRPDHAALDGLVLPTDDPFWQDHTPPWAWGCRCWLTPVTQDELDEVRAGAGYGYALSPASLDRLHTTGVLDRGDGRPMDVRSPRERATTDRERLSAFWWNPGDLQIPLETIRGRYDPTVWEAFTAAMKRTAIEWPDGARRPVWDWIMDGERRDIDRAALRFAAAGGAEKAFAVSRTTGERLESEPGSADRVSVAEMLKGADPGGEWIVSHAHASGKTLSPDDLWTFLDNGRIIELRAPNKSGVFVLRRTPGTGGMLSTAARRKRWTSILPPLGSKPAHGEMDDLLLRYSKMGVWKYERPG